MAAIKKITGIVTSIRDLSDTAREITITLKEPFDFLAGSFVNIFILSEGKIERRAFSISSSDTKHNTISVSVRLNPKGVVTPLFWSDHIYDKSIEVMGPLGINTADKMLSSRIFLFGYGIGAGVVKSLSEHFVTQDSVKELIIMTGNRSNNEIIHKGFFDQLAEGNKKVRVEYIVSNQDSGLLYKKGYIQDHIGHLDFTNGDIYVCGQEVACAALIETVKKTNPKNCHFFVEGFH